MKKLSYVLLTSLLIAGLTGCGNNKKEKKLTDQEIVEEAANNPALLLSSGGAIIYANTTTQMKSGDFFLGMNSYEYSETQKVEITWSFDKADKWTVEEYKKDPTRSTLTPATVYDPALEYKTTITATAKLNSATATATFYTYMNRLQVTIKSIKEYREGYAKGDITGAENIRFFGYVTGKMGDTYAGVYVASGDMGIMLYAGNLEAQWNANGLKVGDLVDVMGAASPYNGLFEVKPQWVKKAAQSDIPLGYDLSEPAKNDIPDSGFNATELNLKDGSLVTMENLKYLGAGDSDSKAEIGKTEFDPTSHAYIWFSTEFIHEAAFINKVNDDYKAYLQRSGAGTTADPYVYTDEITDITQGTYVVDAANGNMYKKGENGLEKIDMSKRIDSYKGYVADGKFYSDEQHTKEITPTYGGIFLNLENNDFYFAKANSQGKLEFIKANLGDKFEFEIEIPCYYNYHQGNGQDIAELIETFEIRESVVEFDGILSWYNGPNLAPIMGASCFHEYKQYFLTNSIIGVTFESHLLFLFP